MLTVRKIGRGFLGLAAIIALTLVVLIVLGVIPLTWRAPEWVEILFGVMAVLAFIGGSLHMPQRKEPVI